MPALEATLMIPPRPRSTMRRQEGVGEGDDRLAVDPHLLGIAAGIVVQERARGAEARVVDQQVDLDSELRDPVAQRGGIGGEVAGDGVGFGRELGGEPLQPVGATGDQHQVVAAGGELARELFANSRGSAGD